MQLNDCDVVYVGGLYLASQMRIHEDSLSC